MKTKLLLLSLLISSQSFSQLFNGNFETWSAPDLSYWEWTCNAYSFNDAPTGGGDWCIEVEGGNLQGCFPGFAYQKLPTVVSGQAYILSGWAKTVSLAGIYFGSINNGIIDIQAGDTTSSTNWTYLSSSSQFTLGPGDTAVVLLHGGTSTGPILVNSYFDLITLVEDISAVPRLDHPNPITISPSPFTTEAIISTETNLIDANLAVYNLLGEIVMTQHHLFGKSITLHRGNLPEGIYVVELFESGKVFSIGRMMVAGE